MHLPYSQRQMLYISNVLALFFVIHAKYALCAPEAKRRRTEEDLEMCADIAGTNMSKKDWGPQDTLYIQVCIDGQLYFKILGKQMDAQDSCIQYAQGNFSEIEKELKRRVAEQKKKAKGYIWVRILERKFPVVYVDNLSLFSLKPVFSIIGKDATTIIEVVNNYKTELFFTENNQEDLKKMCKEKERKIFDRLDCMRKKEHSIVIFNPVFGLYSNSVCQIYHTQLIYEIKKIASEYSEMFCMFDKHSKTAKKNRYLKKGFFEYFLSIFTSSVQLLFLIMFDTNLQVTPSIILPAIFGLKIEGKLTVCTPLVTKSHIKITKDIPFTAIDLPNCIFNAIHEKVLEKHISAGHSIVIRNIRDNCIKKTIDAVKNSFEDPDLIIPDRIISKPNTANLSLMTPELRAIVENLFRTEDVEYCTEEIAIILSMKIRSKKHYNIVILSQKNKKQKEEAAQANPSQAPTRYVSPAVPEPVQRNHSQPNPTHSNEEDAQTEDDVDYENFAKNKINELIDSSRADEGLQSACSFLDPTFVTQEEYNKFVIAHLDDISTCLQIDENTIQQPY